MIYAASPIAAGSTPSAPDASVNASPAAQPSARTSVARDDTPQPGPAPRTGRLALIGTFPPRQCGIATFTQDLARALNPVAENVRVIAMDENPSPLDYGPAVRHAVPAAARPAYAALAEELNNADLTAVVVQHEFGIFGGPDGVYLLDLLERLRVPALVTLHTVLADPSPGQRDVMNGLIRHAARLVVMTEKARTLLRTVYGVDDAQIAVVPHGIHPAAYPTRPGPLPVESLRDLDGRPVLLTFGLLGRGKGIETAIAALPDIVKRHPDAVYLVVGATHPHVLRHEGDRYRDELREQAAALSVADHLRFHDAFVDLEELQQFLAACTVYLVPYPNEAQICSGTLAYAAGSGNAVVSTPFWHAQELLADGRGRTFGFHDPAGLSTTVNELLDDPVARDTVRRAAYDHGKTAWWPRVGERYARLAEDVRPPASAAGPDRDRDPAPSRPASGGDRADRHPRSAGPTAPPPAARTPAEEPPRRGELRGSAKAAGDPLHPAPRATPGYLDHFARLTDDTGMLQHARYAVPDRRHGYCTDDNARALVVAIDEQRRRPAAPFLRDPENLINRYLAFLNDAWHAETGRFRNFMAFDRTWLEDVGSEDSHGRALWALGHAAAYAPFDGQRRLAVELLHDAFPRVTELQSPRAWAYAMLGARPALDASDADGRVSEPAAALAHRLIDWSTSGAYDPDDRWPWPETEVTYAAARVPQALLQIGTAHPRTEEAHAAGLRQLRWLVGLQLGPDGTVNPVGNHGWLTRGGRRAAFDQQALEIPALVAACLAAARVTDDDRWTDAAARFAAWFTGYNRLDVSLLDPESRGVYDGLHPGGLNRNQGAESVLAYAMTVLALDPPHDPVRPPRAKHRCASAD